MVIALYDVLIVGGGPAGSSLARLIAHKYSVALLDKRFSPGNKRRAYKTCGGLLAPDAQKMLARMGVALPRDVLVDPQIFAVRAIDLATARERYYQRFYINIDRECFDRWLLSLVPLAVDTFLGSQYIEAKREAGDFAIKFNQNGCIKEIKAKILVGADGASSPVRRHFLNDCSSSARYLAIQEYIAAEEQMPFFSAIFDPSITDFYAWAIPKEQHLLLGAALSPGKNAKKRFYTLKEKLSDYGYRLHKSSGIESALVLRPRHPGQVSTGLPGLLLIGEAAGLISPSSAEGISYAFASALFAAEALYDGLPGAQQRYRKLIRNLKRSIFLKNFKSPAMYFPPFRRAIMAGGFFSIKIDKTASHY